MLGVLVLVLTLAPVTLAGVLVARAEREARETRRIEPRADGPPVTHLPSDSPLGRLSQEHSESWWRTRNRVAGALFVILGLVCVALLMLDHARWRANDPLGGLHGPGRVAAKLELLGYVSPRITRTDYVRCRGGRNSFGYRWTAQGAQGRACLYGGHVYRGHVAVWEDRAWPPTDKAPPP